MSGWRSNYHGGPCYECNKRHVGCHSSCGELISYKESCEKAKEKERQHELMVDYICKTREYREKIRKGIKVT